MHASIKTYDTPGKPMIRPERYTRTVPKIPFDLDTYRKEIAPYVDGKEDAGVFWKALDFAAAAHEDQWRKSGDAYILHPCSVAMILAHEMDLSDPEILAAALLHDTVEDVEEVTSEIVGKEFGVYVQAIVEGCTKVTKTSGSKQARSQKTHRKIFSGAALRPEVMLVKLADRLHNLRTLNAMPKRKQQQVADETLDIYAPLANVFGLFNIKREMYNYALMFRYPKQWGKVGVHINSLKNDPTSLEIVRTLETRLRNTGIDAEVEYRVKDLWAYYDYNAHILLHKIDFPTEIHIIVNDPNPSTCYWALGTLNLAYSPIPRTIRDFIANPKPTGYQSLHARAIIGGKKYLFKIRTPEMARKAQRGIFRNWSSKLGNQQQFIKQIQDLFRVIGSDSSVSYRDMIAASGKKEIYTYTPKGDLIYLPIDSTVLDFAFRVHTDIGHTCLGAIVGNQRRPPSHILRDGDVVRIIRSRDPQRFSPDILDLCKSPRTRTELGKIFRVRREKGKQIVAREALSQELRRYDVSPDVLECPEMQSVYASFSMKGADDFYLAIGEGRLRLDQAVSRMNTECHLNIARRLPRDEGFNTIELKTLDPVFIKLSSCCNPCPTHRDNVNVALLTPERLSVHRRECQRFEEEIEFQREEVVNIVWNLKETTLRKPQTLIIRGVPRQRLMMLLSVAPTDVSIQELTMVSPVHVNSPDWRLGFEALDLAALEAFLKHIEKSGVVFHFELSY